MIVLYAASVRVIPDRSQFFSGESLTLSCEDRDWTLRRNTSRETRSRCGKRLLSEAVWGTGNGSSCAITALHTMDTGPYWCESRERQTSDIININVTEGTVVPWSPVLPVTEAQTVSTSPESQSSSNSGSRFVSSPGFKGILLAVLLLCAGVFLVSVILVIKNSFWKKPPRAEPSQTSPNNDPELFYVSVKKRDKCNKPNKTNVTEEDVEYSSLSFPSSVPNS